MRFLVASCSFSCVDSFYRSIRNLVIDLRDMNATSGTGIHWEVSQATSLYNIVVEMSDANNTGQLGMFMEDGSGGFMADLVFNGGVCYCVYN